MKATVDFVCGIEVRGKEYTAYAKILPHSVGPHVSYDSPRKFEIHPAKVVQVHFMTEDGYPAHFSPWENREAESQVLGEWIIDQTASKLMGVL